MAVMMRLWTAGAGATRTLLQWGPDGVFLNLSADQPANCRTLVPFGRVGEFSAAIAASLYLDDVAPVPAEP